MLTSQGPPVNTLSAFIDVESEATDAKGYCTNCSKQSNALYCMKGTFRACMEVNCSSTIYTFVYLYIVLWHMH